MAPVSLRIRVALCALLGAGCAWSPAPRLETGGHVRLRHEAQPGMTVSVVGDFNGWTPGQDPLREVGPGRYEGILQLGPGAHSYAFAQAIDGGVEVVIPEAAPGYVDDDLGGRDGVLQIPGEQ
ncbi:MAG: hypothetical protein JST54_27810 [Deltaproteobacteria bacterium]|nr:hypothetical protein [Deltaproteobacteria bacterium]